MRSRCKLTVWNVSRNEQRVMNGHNQVTQITLAGIPDERLVRGMLIHLEHFVIMRVLW